MARGVPRRSTRATLTRRGRSGERHAGDDSEGPESSSRRRSAADPARRAAGLGDEAVPPRELDPHPHRGDRAPHGRAEPGKRDRRLLPPGGAQRRRGRISAQPRLRRREEPRRRPRCLGPDYRSGHAPVLMGGGVLVERTGDVVRCILDRPPLNLLDPELIDALRTTFTGLAADPSVRVAVLTGRGRAFTAGMNVHVLHDLDVPRAKTLITALHAAIESVHHAPFPVLAGVNGHCLGAGFELALACDLRIAASGATFGLPEVRVGVPSVIEAALLPGLVGPGRAAELLLTGEAIDAARAEAWGLINQVVPAVELTPTVEALVAKILAAGPTAVRLQKELMLRWRYSDLGTAIRYGINAFAAAYASGEPAEGAAAFLAKRAPKFEVPR